MHYQRVSEVKQKERDCLENNARQVAQELAAMVMSQGLLETLLNVML